MFSRIKAHHKILLAIVVSLIYNIAQDKVASDGDILLVLDLSEVESNDSDNEKGDNQECDCSSGSLAVWATLGLKKMLLQCMASWSVCVSLDAQLIRD